MLPFRRPAFRLGLAAILLSFATAHAEDRVLNVVSPWELDSLEPAETGYVAARLGIAETLTGVEPDGRIVGQVADRWTVSADRLTWRFHIRSGQRFHDGSAVTPAAVASSFERGRSRAETLQTVPFARVAAEGEDVVIETTTPFAPLPAYLTDWGAIILAPAAYRADGSVAALIGTGPYALTAQQGRTLDLTATEMRSKPPAIRRVHYTAAPQGETRAAMVEAGDADIAYTLLPAAIGRIEASGHAHVESLVIPRVTQLTFDMALPLFADVRVRRAISLALDRVGIATAVMRNRTSAATQLLAPVLAGWNNPSLPPLGMDVTRAAALLAEAGWARGADGVLRKGDTAFRFTLTTLNNRPELAPIAAAVQAQLQALGIELSIRVLPYGAFQQARAERAIQSALLVRTYVNVPDPIGTLIPDFTRPQTIWASQNWRNDEMAKLAADYTAGFDPAATASIRSRMTEILQTELPVVPIAYNQHVVAVSNRVRNLQIDPFEARYLLERATWAD